MKDDGSFMCSIALARVGICIESNAFDISCNKSQISFCIVEACSIIVVSYEIGWVVDCRGKAA